MKKPDLDKEAGLFCLRGPDGDLLSLHRRNDSGISTARRVRCCPQGGSEQARVPYQTNLPPLGLRLRSWNPPLHLLHF